MDSSHFIQILMNVKTEFGKRIKMVVFMGEENYAPPPPPQDNCFENIQVFIRGMKGRVPNFLLML